MHIKDSFRCIGINPLSSRLASINVDGAAINTGIHSGLGVKFKETAPWISVIHCFNHGLELAVRDSSMKCSSKTQCWSNCTTFTEKV